MCEKKPNEPWMAFFCRYIVEQPRAQEKTIRVLSEMSVRLQTIEHRMEVYHKQPPPTPPQ